MCSLQSDIKEKNLGLTYENQRWFEIIIDSNAQNQQGT